MYEIFGEKNDIPSPEDLELISKLDNKGKYLVEDLYKIFSYKKPKEFKLFIDKKDTIQSDEEKVIIELILIIQKYNKVLSQRMSLYQEKNNENKFFSSAYKSFKINSDLFKEANSSNNLLNGLVTKYEEKNRIFNAKFFKSNIFNQCGLLPTTKKQNIDFFEAEIQKNGQNSYKSLKSIRFIEKLYEQIEKISKKLTLSQAKQSLMNAENEKLEKKAKYLYKLNQYRVQKKEINDNMEEIKKLKELLAIANTNYQRIMQELKIKKNNKNKRNRKKHLSKLKSKEENDVQIGTNNEIEKKTNEEKNDEGKKNIKDKNYGNKSFIKLKSFQISNKYYRTSSVERFNGLNLNKDTTLSTGFCFNNKNINSTKTFYKNIPRNIINNLSSFSLSNRSNKSILLPLKEFKTLSRNNSNNNFTSMINNLSNLTAKNIMNKTFKIHKHNILDKNINQSNSAVDILTPKINVSKLYQKQYEVPKQNSLNKKKPNLRKIKSPRKEHKVIKSELYLMRKKKVPIIYEELKNCRNLLSITKRNDAQKANRLFLQLYDKKKIDYFNEKNSTQELYNSYCKMKDSIERCHGPERIFRKYKNNITVELKDKIGKSIDQDNQLKNKYYDFMQMVIKKKLGEDENKFL